MSTTYSLKNIPHMQKIIKLISGNPLSVNAAIDRFPFHELCEISPLCVDVISHIFEVFSLFMKYGNVKEHLLPMMRFCNQTIQCLINQDTCDFHVVERALTEFKTGLHRETALAVNYGGLPLIASLHSVVHHPNVPENVLLLAVETFAIYIQFTFDMDAHFGVYCSGIWKASNELSDDTRLMLASSLINNTDEEIYPNKIEVYQYIFDYLKKLHTADIDHVRTVILIVLKIYEKCKSKDTLMMLSTSLAGINFPRCIADYFLTSEENLQQMHQIFYQEISVIFEKTPWNSTKDSLRDIVTNLGKAFLLKPDPDDCSEFNYLVLYLELIYKEDDAWNKCEKWLACEKPPPRANRVTKLYSVLNFILEKLLKLSPLPAMSLRHTDTPIVKSMVKQYAKKLPTNPAVLKTVYQLYAAYGGVLQSSASRAFQNDLLLSLQQCEDLESYLTFHIAQLVWVLRYGSRILKRRVVTIWIRQQNGSVMGLLCKSLKFMEQVGTLLDVLFYDDDAAVKREALDLYALCAPGHRIQLTYMLLKPDLTVDTLDCIMKGQPKEFRLCKPSDPRYGDEVMRMRALIQRLIGFLTNEQIELKEQTRGMILIHLHNTCWQLRKTENAECFVTGKLVKILVEAAQSKSARDARSAFEFLMLIATTEVYLQLTLSDRVTLEPSPLHGDQLLIKSAVQLYHYVLNHNYADHYVISMHGKHLALYHNLMDVLTSSEGHSVYQLIVFLLERYEACVTSMINISAIRVYCRSLTLNVNFVKYLTVWCQLAPNYKHIPVPVRNIGPYVRYLKTIDYKDADYAILWKYVGRMDF